MSRNLIGLKAMRYAAQPGECICCGADAIPLSSRPSAVAKRMRQSGTHRTHQDTCGSEECATARMKLWRRDQRNAAQSPETARQCESGVEASP
jgi:hypothetical protein